MVVAYPRGTLVTLSDPIPATAKAAVVSDVQLYPKTTVFTRDGAGNIQTIETTIGTLKRTETFAYDGAGNITGITTTIVSV